MDDWQYLSTPSLGITYAVRPHGLGIDPLHLSTPSLGITEADRFRYRAPEVV
jgi:hypothetical protein